MRTIIKNARILTADERTIERGYVMIEEDMICEVDAGELPASLETTDSDEVVDADGLVLMPGIIDAHCHIGLHNEGLGVEGRDYNEITNPVTPQLLAIDSIFHDDCAFHDALAHGITTAMTGPGSANIIGGHFALVHTVGATISEQTVVEKAAMKGALGENPKRCYGPKDKSPQTRMANAAVLRDALTKATWYAKQKEAKGDDLKPDPAMEALLPVLSGKRIMKIHAHRADDILTAVRICNEFGLRYTLDHCTEGHLIADQLAEEYRTGQKKGHGKGKSGKGRLVGVINGPLLTSRSKPELSRRHATAPGILAAKGIPVAIMTDHPVIPIEYLPLCAAVAVREGMDEELALQAITSKAALMCDQADRLGKIKAGFIADLILLDGHPFEIKSKVQACYVNGRKVFAAAGS